MSKSTGGSPGTAFAHVYDNGNHVTARGKVHATKAAKHGAWSISVSVPADYDGDAGHYTKGLSTQVKWVRGVGEEDDGNSTAWISGHDAQGNAFFCHAQEPQTCFNLVGSRRSVVLLRIFIW